MKHRAFLIINSLIVSLLFNPALSTAEEAGWGAFFGRQKAEKKQSNPYAKNGEPIRINLKIEVYPDGPESQCYRRHSMKCQKGAFCFDVLACIERELKIDLVNEQCKIDVMKMESADKYLDRVNDVIACSRHVKDPSVKKVENLLTLMARAAAGARNQDEIINNIKDLVQAGFFGQVAAKALYKIVKTNFFDTVALGVMYEIVNVQMRRIMPYVDGKVFRALDASRRFGKVDGHLFTEKVSRSGLNACLKMAYGAKASGEPMRADKRQAVCKKTKDHMLYMQGLLDRELGEQSDEVIAQIMKTPTHEYRRVARAKPPFPIRKPAQSFHEIVLAAPIPERKPTPPDLNIPYPRRKPTSGGTVH